MKKLIIVLLVLVALGVGAGAYYMRRSGPEPKVDTLQVTRGDIADVVLSTGTLEAVTTVNVGTQVSGMVQDLYADYNSIVKKGQIIARLDPSLIQTAIERSNANVVRSRAEIERLEVSLEDAKRKLAQAEGLWEKQLIPRDQLETAQVTVKNLAVQIKASEASLVQAQADLNTQQVNLQHTVIKSPIDGIVISRQVEPGQTVAASMNAPTLFIIAGDLAEMRVIANIDEADVGRVRQGQPVTFRVDGHPNDVFRGTVDQVRLQPTVVQNVVTYSTVILVPNPQLKLMPGMTANLTVEIARRSNVLRVPAAALRFRPTADHFAALNLPVPPEIASRGGFAMGGGRGGRAGDGRAGASATPPASGAPAQQGATQPAPQPAGESRGQAAQRGGGDAPRASGESRPGGGRGGFDPNMTPEERAKRMQERLASMTPEERERWEQRMRERGGRGQGPGESAAPRQGGAREGGNPRWDARQGITTRASGGSSVASGATTIDALFAPVVIPERPATVWLWVDRQLRPVRIRYGITDGTWNEVVEGDLKEGQEIVTNISTGVEPRTTPGQGGNQNPLMGPQRGGRGPGGGGRGR
jgi:HlyD family secretion protein